VRIAHLADLHLGYRAYHRVNSRGVNMREADVAEAFRRVVGRTIELRPDLVLVAGDVFHTVRPSNTAIAEAFRQFSVLCERLPDVPVVMIAGNHDSPRSADTGNILTLFREIPGIHVVCDECRPLKLPQLETTILCVPHNSLAVDHETVMEPDPSARHNILMLHGTVTGKTGEPRLKLTTEYGGANIAESDIRAERWDYVALGHHHLAEALAPNMWYAGGIERTSATIWMEEEDKGFVLYDTDAKRGELVPIETREIVDRPWIEAKGLSAEEVDARIQASVETIPGGIRSKMVRLVVTDVPRHLARELNHRRIREWKAEALHFHLDVRPPEVRRRAASGAPVKRLTLREQVEAFLKQDYKPRMEEVDRERLVAMGTRYIDGAAEEG
jgi:DNA repair exonuclease SbcCD nuclease subunit